MRPVRFTLLIPEHNARFMVRSEEEGSAFVPWAGNNLRDILCIQEERVVGRDNTVSYQNKKLQIPADSHRYHYVKVAVQVHEHEEGGSARVPWATLFSEI